MRAHFRRRSFGKYRFISFDGEIYERFDMVPVSWMEWMSWLTHAYHFLRRVRIEVLLRVSSSDVAVPLPREPFSLSARIDTFASLSWCEV